MTVTEALTAAGLTPAASYSGEERTDDWILAIKTGSSQTVPAKYDVVADHVREHSGAINATTTESTYIRTGTVVQRTGASRQLTINGDRCVGDDAQDYLLSHAVKYGTGMAVHTNYVYFSALTGKGETGECTINVTSDVGGAANAPATFAAELRSVGTPSEYTYAAAQD